MKTAGNSLFEIFFKGIFFQNLNVVFIRNQVIIKFVDERSKEIEILEKRRILSIILITVSHCFRCCRTLYFTMLLNINKVIEPLLDISSL